MSLSSLLLIVVIAGVIGGALYFFLKSEKTESEKGSNSKTENETPKHKADPMDSLLQQNLLIRKSRLSEEKLKAYESLIDQLLSIYPRLEQTNPESELSWVVNRMITEYLPNKSIGPYLKMSEKDRESAASSMMESITGMAFELKEIEEMLDSQSSSDFERKAKFLQQRFLK